MAAIPWTFKNNQHKTHSAKYFIGNMAHGFSKTKYILIQTQIHFTLPVLLPFISEADSFDNNKQLPEC